MTQETFERELARRAGEVHGAPLGLDDVRGRARRIQRRRATAAAAAVAAVVAVVAVVPVVLGGGHHSAPEPAPAPAPVPAPGAGLLHDGTLTLPSGATVDLGVDNADVQQVGVLTDGRVVVASSQPYGVQVYGPTGTPQAAYDVQANAFTMSADHRLAAWVGADYRVQVLESGVAEPVALQGIPMPGESAGSVDAVYGADCAAGGCVVLGGDFTQTTTEVTLDGQRDLQTSEPLRVTDLSPDASRWAVDLVPAEGEQLGCGALYDPGTERVTARSCETSGLRFAPDGKHLLGMRGDNNAYSDVATFDLGLHRTGDLSPRGADVLVSRAAWADARNVVVVTADWRAGTWRVDRTTLDGAASRRLVGPDQGDNPEQVVEYLPAE